MSAEYRYSLKKFLKDWALIFCMIAGAGAYLVYAAVPSVHSAGPFLEKLVTTLQPLLVALMLFLSYARIEPHQMRPHRWMAWLLLVQGGTFVAIALLLALFPGLPFRYGLEAAMLCMICPTATACSVVTGKLGGNMAGVVTYTVLINILSAILVPLMLPLVHPVEGMSFSAAFLKILAKVFPLLIMPCLLAWLVRYLLPGLHARILRYTELPFYLWTVALGLAILLSTRSVVHNTSGAEPLAEICVASLISCAFQFWAGKKIGARSRCSISAGQALGQKNTSFAIWLAYMFFTPVVSVAGGFYSIWHNCYNSWQLYKKRKDKNLNPVQN